MENSFKISPKTSLIKMQISGDFDFSQFKQFFTELLNDPLAKPGFNILCDANLLDFSKINTSDIQDLLKLNEFIEQKRGGGKTAFVVSSQLGYGLSRMVEMRMGGSSTSQLRIFLDMKDAKMWLNKESG